MLQLNMVMNGFRIDSIVSQFRAGAQDGAIILGMRAEDKELVVAEVDQFQIDRPEPAEHWMQGHYFSQGPDDTDLNSKAAVKASAFFADRAGITAMVTTVQDWAKAEAKRQAEEARKDAANAALEKVRAASEGKSYTLIYTAYDDALRPKQIDVLLHGDNEWDHPEFSTIEEIESDQRYEAAIHEIKDILDEDEFAALEYETDLLDEARFIIQEHDDSDLVDSLLKTTGSLLVRYDLGVSIDTDYTSTDEDRRAQAIAILAALGVDATVFDVESLIAAVVTILIESGSGQAYMFWYADPHELVTAARPFQQARFTEENPAPPATITFENVELLVLNRFSGSGYSDSIPGTFTIPFDASRLVTDEGDEGYSWNDVAGLVASAFKGDVTIAAATPPPVPSDDDDDRPCPCGKSHTIAEHGYNADKD